MTASEALRALNRRRTDLRFHRENQEDAERDLLDALPLIADVVQAAEREAPFEERGGNTGDLNRALTALQEALNGSAGDGQ